MDGDWDSFRTQLGGDLGYGMGDWFSLPERSVVRVETDRPFAEEKARKDEGGRPIVLASVSGPNAVGYPRTSTIASDSSESRHAAHPQPHGVKRCRINRDGWVVFEVPVNVGSNEISSYNYSCREPDKSGLWAAIERKLRL